MNSWPRSRTMSPLTFKTTLTQDQVSFKTSLAWFGGTVWQEWRGVPWYLVASKMDCQKVVSAFASPHYGLSWAWRSYYLELNSLLSDPHGFSGVAAGPPWKSWCSALSCTEYLPRPCVSVVMWVQLSPRCFHLWILLYIWVFRLSYTVVSGWIPHRASRGIVIGSVCVCMCVCVCVHKTSKIMGNFLKLFTVIVLFFSCIGNSA